VLEAAAKDTAGGGVEGDWNRFQDPGPLCRRAVHLGDLGLPSHHGRTTTVAVNQPRSSIVFAINLVCNCHEVDHLSGNLRGW
jgi:hypothetical protein